MSLTKIIRSLFVSLFFITPTIFTSLNSELFELPKMYLIYFVTIIMVTLHLVNYFRGNTQLFRPSLIFLPLILFLAIQTISWVVSIDRHTSFYGYYSRLNGGLLSIIVFTLVAWIYSVYQSDNLRRNIIFSSLVSGFLISVFGIAQHFGIDKHYWVQDVQNRVFSTLGQPNWLAAYLCILLPLSLSEILKTKGSRYFLYLSFFSAYFICLLFTKSKSGIIAAAISLAVFYIIYLYNHRSKLITKSIIPAIILLALSLTVRSPITDQLFPKKSSPVPIPNPTLNITPSEDIRKIVWQGAINLWRQFPILGTGPETFAYSYYWTRPAAHNLTSEWEFLYNKAHNEYLNFLATTGAAGLLSYLVLIIFSIYIIVHPASAANGYRLAVFSAYLSILITNFSGFSVAIVSLYFFLLPLIASEPLIQPQPHRHQKPFVLTLIILIIGFYFTTQTIYYYLADITYSMANSADDNNQYSSALDHIRLSLGYRPNEPEYWNKYSQYTAKIALVHHQQKSDQSEYYLNEALKSSAMVKKISPFNINFWKERAQTYYYLSSIDTKYYLESLNALTTASKLAPTDARTFYLLGEFYENISSTDLALENYLQAIKLKSNYDHALFAAGKIYFDRKDYSSAKEYLLSTLKYAPTNDAAQKLIEKIPQQPKK